MTTSRWPNTIWVSLPENTQSRFITSIDVLDLFALLDFISRMPLANPNKSDFTILVGTFGPYNVGNTSRINAC